MLPLLPSSACWCQSSRPFESRNRCIPWRYAQHPPSPSSLPLHTDAIWALPLGAATVVALDANAVRSSHCRPRAPTILPLPSFAWRCHRGPPSECSNHRRAPQPLSSLMPRPTELPCLSALPPSVRRWHGKSPSTRATARAERMRCVLPPS